MDRTSAGDPGIEAAVAYIRHAPMQSPRELGLIHRAAPWQTINLTRGANSAPHEQKTSAALETSGMSYANGDAAILDQVKWTLGKNSGDLERYRSYGRVNLNAYSNKIANGTESDPSYETFKALFNAAPTGKEITPNGIACAAPGDASRKTEVFPNASSTSLSAADAGKVAELLNGTESEKRSQAFKNRAGMVNYLREKNVFASSGVLNAADDILLEGAIGGIALLTEAMESPEVVRVLIVAQSIKDVGAPASDSAPASAAIDIYKTLPGDSSPTAIAAKQLRYDEYADEINGEVKLLATFVRNPLSGRYELLQLENAD